MARESAPQVLPWGSPDRVAVPAGPEVLVTGVADRIDAAPELTELLARAAGSDELLYGWPAVVLTDRTGRVLCAPLLVVDVVPVQDGAWCATDRPQLNEGLLKELRTDPVVAASARRRAAGLPHGDAGAVADGVRVLCAELGLACEDLTPARAGGRLRPGVHGAQNTAVVQLAPPASATRGLREELERLAGVTDEGGTAAARLLLHPRPEPVGDETALIDPGRPVVVSADLNPSQERALRASAAGPVTVVVGPPGTGKSALLAAIVADCAVAGERVLVASTNNGAVDVAVDLSTRASDALLVRTGNREVRERLGDVLRGIAGRLVEAAPTLVAPRARYAAAEEAVRTAVVALQDRATADRRVSEALDACATATLAVWPAGLPPTASLDRLTRAAGSRWWPARRTRRALAALPGASPAADLLAVRRWLAAEQAGARARQEHAGLPPDGVQGDTDRLDRALQGRAVAGRELAARAAAVRSSRHRPALEQLAGLRRDAAGRARRDATRAALDAVGWACTALAVPSSFPLEAGLFDVLVVDEASQCPVAHVLPLAYRARRVVVVGDPHQLAPVSTLGPGAVDAVCEAAGLTVQEAEALCLSPQTDSAYTAFAARADAVVRLEEHYRCHPSVAAWLNAAFYDGRLQVLTPPHRLRGPVQGLHWHPVTGRTTRGPGGGIVNEPEAAAVVERLGLLLPDLLAPADGGGPVSIGIVTPFSGQADLLRRLLERAVSGPDREALRLVVGTAHRLQGDERDVVLLSPVLSQGAEASSVRWLEHERRLLNVAASRARAGLVVVGDQTAARAGRTPTLALLADAAQGLLRSPVVADGDLHSAAERSLHAALRDAGLPVLAKRLVAGHELDLVVLDPDGSTGVDVEVDGTQHVDEAGLGRRRDGARDALLTSLGWTVLRRPAWQAQHEPRAVVADVLSAVERRAAGARRVS